MKNAFTLIELLVVISIIAVLSTIGMTTFQGIQGKARDSIRKQDLRTLATALEIYYQKNNKYVLGSISCSDLATSTSDLASFMTGDIPKDPKGTSYCYLSDNVGQTYTLCAKLENMSDPDINNRCPSESGNNYGISPN